MIDINALKSMESFGLKNYKQGDIIVHEGTTTADDGMYILLKGTVAVWKDFQKANQIQIAALNPGEFFGEMTLFLRKERSATVVAMEDVVAAEINSLDAYEFFEKQPAATYMLITALCRRLNNLNEMYRKLLDGGESGTAGGEQRLSSIFPKAHKKYDIKIEERDPEVYSDRGFKCPMCRSDFKFPSPREHMLKIDYTDKDLRVKYKNAEPLYYEIISCPQCWYSTFENMFGKGVPLRAARLNDAFEKYRDESFINAGADKSITDIFASYYLAIECAEACFIPSEMKIITAKCWIRLSWLYQDCGDEEMSRYAAEQACAAYTEVFSAVELNGKQMDQVCIITGELNLKLGELKNAREFFFLLKKNKSENKTYMMQAENRLEEIKEKLQSQRGGK